MFAGPVQTAMGLVAAAANSSSIISSRNVGTSCFLASSSSSIGVTSAGVNSAAGATSSAPSFSVITGIEAFCNEDVVVGAGKSSCTTVEVVIG